MGEKIDINVKMLHRKVKRRELFISKKNLECAQGDLCPNPVKSLSMGLEFGIWVNFEIEISHHHVSHNNETLSKGIFRKREFCRRMLFGE